jgi:hypothetical protein
VRLALDAASADRLAKLKVIGAADEQCNVM